MKKQNGEQFPLVSVITPCYNGEEYLEKYFASLQSQTYPNIEVIFVNDGSNDNSGELAKKYGERLQKERGYTFLYIEQKNCGQAAALNRGLGVFSGEYLTWPDCDDWMTPDCIEKKVDALESNPDAGLVHCNSAFVNSKTGEIVKDIVNEEYRVSKDLFRNLILDNVFCTCGAFMVRSSMLMDVLPDRKIYESRGGQNWQILLPIAYKYDCVFIEEILYNIFVHDGSHSRASKTYAERIKQNHSYKDILIHILNSLEMPTEEKEKYRKLIDIKYIQRDFYVSLQCGTVSQKKENYQNMESNHLLTTNIKRLYWRNRGTGLLWIFEINLFLSRALRKARNLGKSR